MRVNTRNILVISAVLLAIGAAFIISSQYFLIAGIQKIETEEITGDLMTAVHAVDRQGSSLAVISSDYAGWDDTYIFAIDLNEAYIESNLVPETFSGLGIESIYYFDTAGNLLYGDAYDPEKDEIVPVSKELTDALQSLPVISSPEQADEISSGFLKIPGGIWIFAAHPILTSDRKSSSRGHLVMAKPFTSGTVADIIKETNLDITAEPLSVEETEVAIVPGTEDPADLSREIVISPEVISAETLIYDITGKPIFSLVITSPRDTFQFGQKAVLNSVIMFLFIMVTSGGLAYLYLGSHLTVRIEDISRRVRSISGSAVYEARLVDEGNDELTTIVHSVNSLLDTIQESVAEIEGSRKALEDSERKYRHLFEAANEAIFIMDTTGILECNRAAEEMAGMDRTDLAGNHLNQILGTCITDPDGIALADHSKAAYHGEPRHFACERHFSDQTVRHFSVSLSRFTGTGTVYLLAIVRDITTFVKNKEHLRITQFSMDNADDAIYWVKKDGAVTYGNRAAAQSLCYTAKELTSLKIWDINPNLAEDTWPSVWEKIADGTLVHEESRLMRSDATVFPIAQTNSYLSTHGEEFTCIFARDITETVEMREREKKALGQIEENLLSLAILNDHIRNPLTIIAATADLQVGESREKILSQVDVIDEIVRKLDQGWLESAKIREFLIKHYEFEQDNNTEES